MTMQRKVIIPPEPEQVSETGTAAEAHAAVESCEAAEARVTPQELAAALKSIESRSSEAAPRDDRTVLIGEALRDLNLDWAPEEVMAEIEARRVRQGQALLAARRVKRNRILALAVALCALASIWAGYQGFWIAPSIASSVAGRPGMVQRSHFTGVSDPGFDASSDIRPLSTLPEDRSIHVSIFTLRQILDGQPQAHVLVDARENLAAPWTITKRRGAIYITTGATLKVEEML